MLRWQTVSGSRSERELHARLVHGYNRQARPVRSQVDPVSVRLVVSLVDVTELDETLGQIGLKLWITLVSRTLHYNITFLFV